jgi:hypothetical protein
MAFEVSSVSPRMGAGVRIWFITSNFGLDRNRDVTCRKGSNSPNCSSNNAQSEDEVWALSLKMLYSGLICVILAILFRELYLVWLDDTVYIGSFNVISEGGEKDEAAGADFAKRILGAQAILSRQLLDYQKRGGPESPTDATYTLPGSSSLALPPEALKGVDITIQNVNLREVFSAIRKGFSAPNEVTGHVTKGAGSVFAAVEWPRAPTPVNGEERLTQFLAPSQGDMQSSAAYIACSLSWARAGQVKGGLANVPRVQFCDFARALGELYALSDKASTPDGLSDSEAALVRKRAAELRAHYGSTNILSDLYRLRADLLDLIPERLRNINELVEGQEDRLSYAMLSPGLQKLSDSDRRFAAQALARPAIALFGGKLVDIPHNWANLLSRRGSDIARVAQSTGVLVTKKVTDKEDPMPWGTAFVVAPNLAVTTAHVARAITEDTINNGRSSSVCFGSSIKDCKESLSIGRVIFRGEVDKEDIAVVELLNHDPVLIPPLPIADPLPEPNVIVGRYAYIVGFFLLRSAASARIHDSPAREQQWDTAFDARAPPRLRLIPPRWKPEIHK